jgi:transposase-like protein
MPRYDYRCMRCGKLTKDLIERLCSHLAKGTPLSVACKAVNIYRSTIYDWMEKAQERGGLYAELKERLEAAEAQSNLDMIEVIRACAIENRDWKAAQFLLMARLPNGPYSGRQRAASWTAAKRPTG